MYPWSFLTHWSENKGCPRLSCLKSLNLKTVLEGKKSKVDENMYLLYEREVIDM